MIKLIPALDKIVDIIMIWYLTAINGSTPERICPVIIPGSETNPTANKEFIWGIRADLNAIFLAFSKDSFRSNYFSNLSIAKDITFIELASIIPAIGITYLGS